MSQLDRVIGGGESVAALKTALAAGGLSHAVLLCAPDGCGRNFAARCLAADYLHPAGGHGAAAVLAGQSSEVLLVAGEGKNGMIPVGRIRAVRADVFHSALSAAGRVVLVRDAHQMAAPAANALLKVLEEPPADALFILTARSPALLAATITSRCAVYTLAPPALPECRAALAAAAPPGTNTDLPALLAVLYGGAIGAGLRVLESPTRLQTLQDALAAARAAAARGSYEMLRIFARYEGRGEDEAAARLHLLDDLAATLAACLRAEHTPGLPAIPPAAAALLLPPVTGARAALRGNGAPKITFAALAVQLAGAGVGA